MTDRGDRLQSSKVRLHHTLRDAMIALERANSQIVLVTDDRDHLLGIMTDGDIRRALLGGAAMETPLEQFARREFISVGPGAGRAEVLDIMQSRLISQIPIIDASSKIVGLHLLHEIVGAVERPNWAVIMCGGKGLRLLPLTASVPKPMLRVAGRPILERIVLHLVGSGIRRIFLAVNYLSEQIEAHFGDGERFGCRIDYVREDKPLGTGGALSLLKEEPTAPLLVLNGDLVVQFNVGDLFDFHTRGGYAATVAVHQYAHKIPLGVVDVSENRIIGMREKPTETWTANAGIYALDPPVLKNVPADSEFALPALIEKCLQLGKPVGAFPIDDGEWIDIGRVKELRRARGEFDS